MSDPISFLDYHGLTPDKRSGQMTRLRNGLASLRGDRGDAFVEYPCAHRSDPRGGRCKKC